MILMLSPKGLAKLMYDLGRGESVSVIMVDAQWIPDTRKRAGVDGHSSN